MTSVRTPSIDSTTEFETMHRELVRRLDRLARVNKLLLSFLLVIASGALLGVMLGARADDRTLEAEKFMLRDSKGVVRAMLTSAGDGSAGLYLYDTAGKNRLFLGTRDPNKGNDAILWAAGENAKKALVIRADPDGSPSIDLTGKDGKAGLFLSVVDGYASASFQDEQKRSRVTIGFDEGVGPHINLKDNAGLVSLSLGTLKTGLSHINFYRDDKPTRTITDLFDK